MYSISLDSEEIAAQIDAVIEEPKSKDLPTNTKTIRSLTEGRDCNLTVSHTVGENNVLITLKLPVPEPAIKQAQAIVDTGDSHNGLSILSTVDGNTHQQFKPIYESNEFTEYPVIFVDSFLFRRFQPCLTSADHDSLAVFTIEAPIE